MGFFENSPMTTKQMIIAGAVLAVAATGAYFWWQGREKCHGKNGTDEGTVQTPVVSEEQARQIAQQERTQQAADNCIEEARRRIRLAPSETPEQREAMALEEDWLEYLQGIQAEENFLNWSGRPCDLYLQAHAGTVSRAVELNLATLLIQGNGLEKVTITVASPPYQPILNQSLVIPVGTVFASSSSNTQSMIASSSVAFSFYPSATGAGDDNSSSRNEEEFPTPAPQPALFHPRARSRIRNIALVENPPPQSVTHDVPSYCINRWREIPSSSANFSVAAETEENKPLRTLVACLDQSSAPHFDKQRAVWMLSDHLLDLSPQELAEKFMAERESHGLQTPSAFAEALQKDRPDLPADKLEKIRRMTQEQFQLWHRAIVQAGSAEEVKNYREITRPLLEGCGVSLSSSAFFR